MAKSELKPCPLCGSSEHLTLEEVEPHTQGLTMDNDSLEQLRELLCEFSCKYVLSNKKEAAVDKMVKTITNILEKQLKSNSIKRVELKS